MKRFCSTFFVERKWWETFLPSFCTNRKKQRIVQGGTFRTSSPLKNPLPCVQGVGDPFGIPIPFCTQKVSLPNSDVIKLNGGCLYGIIYPCIHAAIMLYFTATAVGEGLAPPAFSQELKRRKGKTHQGRKTRGAREKRLLPYRNFFDL